MSFRVLSVFSVSLLAFACGAEGETSPDPAGTAGQAMTIMAGAGTPGVMQTMTPAVGGSTQVDMTATGMAGAAVVATGGTTTVAPMGGAPAMPDVTMGGTPATGGAAMMAAAGTPGMQQGMDPRPMFSFFVPSQEGLLALAPSPDGFGGDLGGLAGADAICTMLAQASSPGDTKTWHAFLSATEGLDGNGPVNAIDRIGNGPWYNYNGLLFANSKDELVPTDASAGRPPGADPQLAAMFTDEFGAPVSPDTTQVDNHDTLTGSDANGQLMGGPETTCQDWTSTDTDINDAPRVGHAWPRGGNRGGLHWISEHNAGGCAPGVDTTPQPSNGTNTVGAGGGYGQFYCFALSE